MMIVWTQKICPVHRHSFAIFQEQSLQKWDCMYNIIIVSFFLYLLIFNVFLVLEIILFQYFGWFFSSSYLFPRTNEVVVQGF